MQPTNLLIIMSDQHSRRVIGSYGNDQVHTPTLDSLADRGTQFDNAYCPSPVCVPSRASMATGRYPHALGNWDNDSPYTGSEAASWGHRLAETGHRVTTVGKLHFSSSEDATGFADQRLAMHVNKGVGGVTGLLRSEAPPSRAMRESVLEAGVGESDYTRYDRAVGEAAATWIKTEASKESVPWALFVSFVTPHHPLIVPKKYWDLYPDGSIDPPVRGEPDEWPTHAALEVQRRTLDHDRPFDEEQITNARRAYYGLVSFLDDQIAVVLDALAESGLSPETRVLYTSDHGDTLGDHGLWFKCSMYEGSVGIPMIVAGPDIPEGKKSQTPVSLVDVFPSALEAVTGEAPPADPDLPGRSLWQLAAEPDDPDRVVFSEYHANFSAHAIYMLRRGRYKYIHYVGFAPQLFDLVDDPEECHDLSAEPGATDLLAEFEAVLRDIVDPEAIDAAAKESQHQRLESYGGAAAVVERSAGFAHTPPPEEFRQ